MKSRHIWQLSGLVAGILIGAWFLPSLLLVSLLIFAGMLFGNFLAQLSVRFAKVTNYRYGTAFSIVILSLSLLVVGTFYYMGSRITSQIMQLTEQLDQAGSEVSTQFNLQDSWQRLKQFGPQGQPAWAANQAVSTATSAAWITLSAAGGVLVIAFLGFYFALQPDRYRKGFLVLFKPSSRQRIERVLQRAGIRLWQWVLGRLVGVAVIGVCTFVGLWLLGIPLPVTLAVLAGVLNFVPNVGPIIAGVPAVLLGLQQGTNMALYVLLFYFFLQFVESYFLTPLIDQHQVSIPPGLMLSAQLVLGVIAGFLGLLLATPLTVLITILINDLLLQKDPGSSAQS